MNEGNLAMLEAILFTTSNPLKFADLQKIMKLRKKELEELLEALKNRYKEENCGIQISDMGGYQLVVKPQFLNNVSNLTPHSDLSRGLLRVLSIIAYHQPIRQADIVKVVGNRTYEYVKELIERGLIKAERKSRTKILSTTPRFEEYFGASIENLKKGQAEEKNITEESKEEHEEKESED